MTTDKSVTRSKQLRVVWIIFVLVVSLLFVSTVVTAGALSGASDLSMVPGSPPGDFGKLAPADGLSGIQGDILLSWQSNPDATSYEYCIDNIDNDNCNDKWVSTGGQISVTVSGLAYETAYYWQVRAVNGEGLTEADLEDWWSFTTGRPVRILLPMVLRNTCPGYNLPVETEPNNDEFTPNGLICFDRTYSGTVNDVEDWYSFEWTGEGTIVIDVADFASVGQLILYYDNTAAGSLARESDQIDGHYRVTYSDPAAAAGTYLVRLYAPAPGGELYGLAVSQQ